MVKIVAVILIGFGVLSALLHFASKHTNPKHWAVMAAVGVGCVVFYVLFCHAIGSNEEDS